MNQFFSWKDTTASSSDTPTDEKKDADEVHSVNVQLALY